MARSSWRPSRRDEQMEMEEPFQALRRQSDDSFEDWAPSLLRPRLEVSGNTSQDHWDRSEAK